MLGFFALSFGVVFASSTTLTSPIPIKTIPDFICWIVSFITSTLMPPIAVILVLWAGFLYMTAGGAPDNIRKAQHTLLAVVIGMVILLLAPALIALTIDVLGGINTSSGQTLQVCSVQNAISTYQTVFANIINWFAWFASAVSVAMGLYAGFLYLTSRGSPEQVKKATKAFVFTIIGIAVSILSFSIINIVEIFTK